VEIASALSMLMTHLSRFGRDHPLDGWEFGLWSLRTSFHGFLHHAAKEKLDMASGARKDRASTEI
jgi:hypothetical protein